MRVSIYKLRPKKHPFPIFAWLIMLFQGYLPWRKNAFSHMAISFMSQTGNEMIVDATGKGVRIRRWEQFFLDYDNVEMKMVDVESGMLDFMRWYENHLGKKYDSLSIFGLALRLVGFVSFNKLGGNYKKMICSELILNLMDTFFDVHIDDPDNYDLVKTWDIVSNFGHE